jgi:hypothetical protein
VLTDGNTVYMMILSEQPDKIFTAVSDISPELALSREGDRVLITYILTEHPVMDITAYDNLAYTQK